MEGAFFDIDLIEKRRVLLQADNQYDAQLQRGYYVMGVDVGRLNCTTEVVILKVIPAIPANEKRYGSKPVKKVVNLFSFEEEHFRKQALNIKRIFNKFKPDMVVVDGNGMGVGLVDELVLDSEDPDTGEFLPGLGVYNDDPADPKYKKYESPNTIRNAMYIMKANIVTNTELYQYTQTELMNGRLQFLIDEAAAKTRYLATYTGQHKPASKRNTYLEPFVKTSVLEEQMANLVQENEGANIILKQKSKTIKKDKFSALIYAMAWPRIKERNGKRGGFDVSRMTFFTKGKK